MSTLMSMTEILYFFLSSSYLSISLIAYSTLDSSPIRVYRVLLTSMPIFPTPMPLKAASYFFMPSTNSLKVMSLSYVSSSYRLMNVDLSDYEYFLRTVLYPCFFFFWFLISSILKKIWVADNPRTVE